MMADIVIIADHELTRPGPHRRDRIRRYIGERATQRERDPQRLTVNASAKLWMIGGQQPTPDITTITIWMSAVSENQQADLDRTDPCRSGFQGVVDAVGGVVGSAARISLIIAGTHVNERGRGSSGASAVTTSQIGRVRPPSKLFICIHTQIIADTLMVPVLAGTD